MTRQEPTTIAILGADTVVENAPAQLLEGEGYDAKILQEPSAGNASERPSVGCGTTNPTGLSPRIRLLNGKVSPESEANATVVTTLERVSKLLSGPSGCGRRSSDFASRWTKGEAPLSCQHPAKRF